MTGIDEATSVVFLVTLAGCGLILLVLLKHGLMRGLM
jgi:hypothetical protein